MTGAHRHSTPMRDAQGKKIVGEVGSVALLTPTCPASITGTHRTLLGEDSPVVVILPLRPLLQV